jgi:uncharacterized membrane protein
MRTSLKRLLTFFLQGVLVVAPVVVTVYLIYWLFSSIDNLLPIFTTQDRFGNTVSHNKGLGFVIIIVALIIIGYLIYLHKNLIFQIIIFQIQCHKMKLLK